MNHLSQNNAHRYYLIQCFAVSGSASMHGVLRKFLGRSFFKQLLALYFIILGFSTANAALVGHWTFDETSGTTATDSGSGGNDGSNSGATINQTGKIGQAYLFNSSEGDVVTMTGYKGITGTSSRTVSAWVNTAVDGTNSNFDSISSWGNNSSGGARWDFAINKTTSDGTANTIRQNVKNGHRVGTTLLNDSSWHMLTVTLNDDGSPDSDELALYVDGGIEAYTDTDPQAINTASGVDMRVGSNNSGAHFFNGLIDDFAIWDEQLTADEVKSFHDVGNSTDLVYNASNFDSLKTQHDAATAYSTVNGTKWQYKTGLTESAGLSTSGSQHTVVMNDSGNTGLISISDLYWDMDNNNSGASSGSTAIGTWDGSTNNWNGNSDGSGANTTWDIANTAAHFAAGSDASGTYTVTVNGTHTTTALYFEEGIVTLSGGTALHLGSNAATINVGTGLTAIINTTIEGTEGWRKTGSGELDLTGTLSNTGDIDIDAGLVDRTGTWVIADAASSVQNVTIQSGGDLNVSGTSFIGNSGTGSLVIDGAGSSFSGATVNIGNNVGSVGTLTLSNGGTIEATTVTVQRSGSTFTADTIAIGNASAEIDTLNINSSATITATTIDIGNGGILNLSSADGINGASNILLSGGTFNVSADNAANGIGNLTMTASSVIDMNGINDVNWEFINNSSWTGTLSIWSWDGTAGSAGTSGTDDRLIFDDITGFAKFQQVAFYNDNGSTFLAQGKFIDLGDGTWELVAAPEATTWLGIGLVSIFALYFEISRRKKIKLCHLTSSANI